ncbi:PilW family protein [Dyella koreensis]|uniref:PilW family protein n=1 Tax=Dyella koreensis TaxID=311235 RepID=A0ABW8K451_9GAMM
MKAVRMFRAGQAGLTLIELMVAMVLGLIVAAGVITVFLTTSSHNRVQTQLAHLQEDGRFAITRLVSDLRMANGQYCSNSGGVNNEGGGIYLSQLRAPMVQADNLLGALHDVSTPWGADPYPAKPSEPYSFPSFLSMRGYQCGKTSCTPTVPDGLPSIGKNKGDRVAGSGVLTLRYLDSSGGWALGGTSTMVPNGDGTVHHIAISPATGEPAIDNDHYKPGDLMMLADCSNGQIFAANLQDTNQFYPDAIDTGNNLAMPVAQQPLSAPRLFNFTRDFKTVTYFLRVVDLGDGRTTGALVRRVNGENSEIVRGVERLDFLYGVEDASGATRFLTADQVDDRAAGTIACPPPAPNPLGDNYGCLWRAVKSIEVHLLMNGQQINGVLTGNEMRYAYSIDGNTSPQLPDDASRAVKPADQGFDNRMLRREFNALVSVRNYNP